MVEIGSRHTMPKYEVRVYYVNPDNVDLGCAIFRIDDNNEDKRDIVQVLGRFSNPESLVSELIRRGYNNCGFSSIASKSFDMMALEVNELEQLIQAWARLSRR